MAAEKRNFVGFCDERGYLDQIEYIMQQGRRKGDRTGTGVISLFGLQGRYSLRDQFPLLTTKRMFFERILEELLKFIKESTKAKELLQKAVEIWGTNTSREREEGDLGPVYGFQWRHFGAEHTDMHADYTDHEDDRCQFHLCDGELSCQLYQLWADMGLGVPFNIASYALLIYMIAHITGLKPGDFVHSLGDARIYINHIEPLKVQLQREIRPFPKLKILRKVERIDDFCAEDFELCDYNPHPSIQM